jgi:predicted Zn-dependent protease
MLAAGPGGRAAGQAADLAAESERAKAAMADGRLDEAIEIYTRLVEALPTNAGLQMNLGMARLMAGAPGDALEPLRKATALDSSLVPAWLFLGAANLDLGRSDAAIAPLRKVVAAEPRNAQARQMLGQALLATHRYDDAAAQFEQSTIVGPSGARAWYGIARSYEALARDAYEQLRKAAPDSAWELLLVADVLVTDQKPEEALELYRAALARVPDVPGVHETVAALYDHAGRTELAAEARRQAAATVPDCQVKRAECAFLEKRFKNALALLGTRTDASALYWRARACNELATGAFARLEQLPPSSELRLVQAELLEARGQRLEAVDVLRDGLKLDSSRRDVKLALVSALVAARNAGEALPLARELLQLAPNDAKLLYLYGESLAQTQHLDRAIPLLERAARLRPDLMPARVSLGRALVQSGRAADAIPHLVAASATDEDGSTWYQLAQAYQQTGQPDQARKALDEYRKRQRTP